MTIRPVGKHDDTIDVNNGEATQTFTNNGKNHHFDVSVSGEQLTVAIAYEIQAEKLQYNKAIRHRIGDYSIPDQYWEGPADGTEFRAKVHFTESSGMDTRLEAVDQGTTVFNQSKDTAGPYAIGWTDWITLEDTANNDSYIEAILGQPAITSGAEYNQTWVIEIEFITRLANVTVNSVTQA